MVIWGLVGSFSDAVTLGQPFISVDSEANAITMNSIQIGCTTAGSIVWLNGLGVAQWIPHLPADGAVYIQASQIVSGATVNGTPRLTTATGLYWIGQPNET